MEEVHLKTSQYYKLLQLCRKQSLDEVRDFFDKLSRDHKPLSPRIFFPDPSVFAWSPVVDAAINGDVNVMKYLLDTYGNLIDVNEKATFMVEPFNKCSITSTKSFHHKFVPPLVAACTQDNVEMVQYLVSKGADLNKQAPYWGGPLHVAAQYGCISVMKYLLDSGVDVNTTNYRGCTPLMMMCGLDIPGIKLPKVAQGDDKDFDIVYEIVTFFTSKGANIHQTTKEGYTVMHEAARYGRVDIINVLLAYGMSPLSAAPYNSTSKDYVPCPLYLAAVNRHLDVVQLLTEQTSCPPLAKGDAYLLLANLNDKDNRVFWEKGLLCYKEHCVKPLYLEPIPEYENRLEISSMEELNSAWDTDDYAKIGYKYQKLIVMERCLGVQYDSLLYHILELAEHLLSFGEEMKVIRLCYKAMKALDVIKSCSHQNIDIHSKSRRILFTLFNVITTVQSSFPSSGYVDIINIGLMAYERIAKRDDVLTEKLIIVEIFYCWISRHLIDNLAFSVASIHDYNKFLKQFLCLLLEKRGELVSFLHQILKRKCDSKANVYFLSTFFDVGAQSVINTPSDCETLLHTTIKGEQCSVEVISVLLSYGAHVDAVDAHGKTPIDYCSSDSPIRSLLLSTGPLPLFCHAARTIVSEGIPYVSIDLPKHIVKLIELHDPKSIDSEVDIL